LGSRTPLLGKAARGLVRRYIEKMTGLSRAQVTRLTMEPNGCVVSVMQPPAVSGVGSYGGFQFMLQDQGNNTLSDLDRVAHQIVTAGRERKDTTDLLTTFSANDPQVLVTIDSEKAKAMGIPLSQITTTLGVFMGSQYVNDFDCNNRTYRVYVQVA
jgi:HAE1 family hydrophobic/amphiphilic exporter-1